MDIKIEKEQRKEIVLAILYLFGEHGKEKEKEVSRAELTECIVELQKEITLGYEFNKRLPYFSHELSKDLNDLYFHQGYIYDFIHDYKESLPKTFIALKPLGRGHAKKIIETLSPKVMQAIRQAIETTLKQVK